MKRDAFHPWGQTPRSCFRSEEVSGQARKRKAPRTVNVRKLTLTTPAAKVTAPNLDKLDLIALARWSDPERRCGLDTINLRV